jgi:galactokinase/mevalonate kinase-like predicted kinase
MPGITSVIGAMPYRMALAGGWIDQPFVSKHNPDPTGSMVVVALEPTCRFMDRCGIGTSTRKVAMELWHGVLPDRDPVELVRELYWAENEGQPEPSGSQDMAGLVYPGINRLDYSYPYEGGYFPVHIESNNDPEVARWLESVFYMVPIAQRSLGYNPLGERNLDQEWIRRLGQSGKDCFDAIVAQDLPQLGASMNACMACWEAILPHTLRHTTITVDLMAILAHYQSHYAGAMYSGCGGGYIFVVSQEPVPGGFGVNIRLREGIVHD